MDGSGVTTVVQGTRGYMDPMCIYTGRLTEKSDVYSFGVMLVELLTRKKPFSYLSSEGEGLVVDFATLYAEGNLSQILDPQVMEEEDQNVQKVAALAVECIKLRREDRPTMKQVESILGSIQSDKQHVPDTTLDNAHGDGIAMNYPSTADGSDESARLIQEVSKAFEIAHELGMATILWCYLRNPSFKTKEKDFHLSADLTGQANHLGVTIEADIIKQKLPENNGGYLALNTKESAYGKNDPRIYSELTSDHPIDLCRYQVANCYMGRAGLINSGGASSGASDMAEAVTTAVINKRAGGMGLISGRKAFQRPFKEGVEILNTIQDVYLDNDITIA
jgi:DhnA family fructose-bisphosphate aldolase class Ia